MRGDLVPKYQLVVCPCGTLVTVNKYNKHLSTNLHSSRMHNNTLHSCECGLRYSNNSPSRISHLASLRHAQMLDPSIKKITPSDIPPTNNGCFKKGYAD